MTELSQLRRHLHNWRTHGQTVGCRGHYLRHPLTEIRGGHRVQVVFACTGRKTHVAGLTCSVQERPNVERPLNSDAITYLLTYIHESFLYLKIVVIA